MMSKHGDNRFSIKDKNKDKGGRKMEVTKISSTILALLMTSTLVTVIPHVAIAGDHLHMHACADGQVLKYEYGQWLCADDENTDSFAELNCTTDEIAKFDGSEWVCTDNPGPGISGLERVQENSAFDSVATKEVWATCPSGKKVIGGGYLFFYGGPTVPIRTNAPTLDLNSWIVSGTNFENTEWSVSAIAICADTMQSE